MEEPEPNQTLKNLREMPYDEWEATYTAHAMGKRSDLIPFPSESIQRITNNASGEDTARDALEILSEVMGIVSRTSGLPKDARVLDFGCGWGRMTRLLLRDFAPECIFGVDVDARLIDSANDLIPGISHRVFTSMEALPFDNDQFDLVFANSVFSHLSEASHRFHLREIVRVLKCGGTAVISVLDEQSVGRFYDEPGTREWIMGLLGPESELRQILASQGFHWKSTDRWHEYGIAVTDERWISETWSALGLEPFVRVRGQHKRSQLLIGASTTKA